ncbi:MAG TPA: methionyl-tRNA formyltransferase [Flavobacteriaceae bacterium]|nr:methionyl-tRNA formyltransferase [Flavobacteriaceae bacterium]
MKDLRIVFMGTPDFAVGCLKEIVDNELNVVAVVTTPDRPAGRGRKLRGSAVKEYAVKQDLPILQPENLKDKDFLDSLKAFKADLFVVVAFRLLPKAVWAMPPMGTFNLHASLLPKYRGAAPINWAIIEGEKESGVTTFLLDEKIDTGEILLSEKVTITPEETAGTLHDKLLDKGKKLVITTIKKLAANEIKPKKQKDVEGITYAPKLTSENMRIDWSKDGHEIERHIRGMSPYPSAWTELEEDGERKKVKIYFALFEEAPHDNEIGTIIANKKELKVAVSKGYINILEMQMPGRRKMPILDICNGYTFSKNARMC